jgi:hypothetical protein
LKNTSQLLSVIASNTKPNKQNGAKKKKSMLNPLNWFGGSDDEESASPELNSADASAMASGKKPRSLLGKILHGVLSPVRLAGSLLSSRTYHSDRQNPLKADNRIYLPL